MRAIVTPRLDKGLSRRTRAMPVDAHLRSHRDEAVRLVYQFYYPEKGGTAPIVGQQMIEPQAGAVERVASYHRYTRDLDTDGIRTLRIETNVMLDFRALRHADARSPPGLRPAAYRAGRSPSWLADFTYDSTCQGFVYAALVIDVFARCIVGWWVSSSM